MSSTVNTNDTLIKKRKTITKKDKTVIATDNKEVIAITVEVPESKKRKTTKKVKTVIETDNKEEVVVSINDVIQERLSKKRNTTCLVDTTNNTTCLVDTTNNTTCLVDTTNNTTCLVDTTNNTNTLTDSSDNIVYNFNISSQHHEIKSQLEAQLEAQIEAQIKTNVYLEKDELTAKIDAENREKCAHAFKNGFMNNNDSTNFIIMTTIMKIISDLSKYANCNCLEDTTEQCTYDYDKQIDQIKVLFMYLTTIPKFLKQHPEMIEMTMKKIERFREKEKDNVVLQQTYTYYDMFIIHLKKEIRKESGEHD